MDINECLTYTFDFRVLLFAQGMVGNPRNSTAPARNNVRIEFSVVETTYDNCQQIFLRTLFQEMVLNGVF